MHSTDALSPQALESAEIEDSNIPALDPPAAPFVTSCTPQDLVPPSSRSSFTRVDHDDEQRTTQSVSHDPIVPLGALPTPSPVAASVYAEDRTASSVVTPSDEQKSKTQLEMTPLPELSATDPIVPQTPQTYLTFLHISGKRRTMSFEPDTSIGRVKELVWNSWPADWQDDRPPAPSYLRVLYLGRMLQDDETLSNLKFPTHTLQQPTPSSPSPSGPTPTIVHLSIRPYPLPGEGDAIKKKKKRVPEDLAASNEPIDPNDDAGCCRCIIC